MFDSVPVTTSSVTSTPDWAVRAVRALATPAGLPARPGGLPVLPVLHPVLSSLPRGQVVSVPDGPAAGGRSAILPWALAAQASADGSWCAAVGLPEAGVLAAADLGVDPDRLAFVDAPGRRWADVVATLLGAVDLVVTRPTHRPAPALLRRLTGLARQRGSVLVVVGDWEGAALRVRVAESSWAGVGAGHGRLFGRRARVEVSGRGADARVRACWLWLPDPDGQVRAVRPDEIPGHVPDRAAGVRLAAVG